MARRRKTTQSSWAGLAALAVALGPAPLRTQGIAAAREISDFARLAAAESPHLSAREGRVVVSEKMPEGEIGRLTRLWEERLDLDRSKIVSLAEQTASLRREAEARRLPLELLGLAHRIEEVEALEAEAELARLGHIAGMAAQRTLDRIAERARVRHRLADALSEKGARSVAEAFSLLEREYAGKTEAAWILGYRGSWLHATGLWAFRAGLERPGCAGSSGRVPRLEELDRCLTRPKLEALHLALAQDFRRQAREEKEKRGRYAAMDALLLSDYLLGPPISALLEDTRFQAEIDRLVPAAELEAEERRLRDEFRAQRGAALDNLREEILLEASRERQGIPIEDRLAFNGAVREKLRPEALEEEADRRIEASVAAAAAAHLKRRAQGEAFLRLERSRLGGGEALQGAYDLWAEVYNAHGMRAPWHWSDGTWRRIAAPFEATAQWGGALGLMVLSGGVGYGAARATGTAAGWALGRHAARPAGRLLVGLSAGAAFGGAAYTAHAALATPYLGEGAWENYWRNLTLAALIGGSLANARLLLHSGIERFWPGSWPRYVGARFGERGAVAAHLPGALASGAMFFGGSAALTGLRMRQLPEAGASGGNPAFGAQYLKTLLWVAQMRAAMGLMIPPSIVPMKPHGHPGGETRGMAAQVAPGGRTAALARTGKPREDFKSAEVRLAAGAEHLSLRPGDPAGKRSALFVFPAATTESGSEAAALAGKKETAPARFSGGRGGGGGNRRDLSPKGNGPTPPFRDPAAYFRSLQRAPESDEFIRTVSDHPGWGFEIYVEAPREGAIYRTDTVRARGAGQVLIYRRSELGAIAERQTLLAWIRGEGMKSEAEMVVFTPFQRLAWKGAGSEALGRIRKAADYGVLEPYLGPVDPSERLLPAELVPFVQYETFARSASGLLIDLSPEVRPRIYDEIVRLVDLFRLWKGESYPATPFLEFRDQLTLAGRGAPDFHAMVLSLLNLKRSEMGLAARALQAALHHYKQPVPLAVDASAASPLDPEKYEKFAFLPRLESWLLQEGFAPVSVGEAGWELRLASFPPGERGALADRFALKKNARLRGALNPAAGEFVQLLARLGVSKENIAWYVGLPHGERLVGFAPEGPAGFSYLFEIGPNGAARLYTFLDGPAIPVPRGPRPVVPAESTPPRLVHMKYTNPGLEIPAILEALRQSGAPAEEVDGLTVLDETFVQTRGGRHDPAEERRRLAEMLALAAELKGTDLEHVYSALLARAFGKGSESRRLNVRIEKGRLNPDLKEAVPLVAGRYFGEAPAGNSGLESIFPVTGHADRTLDAIRKHPPFAGRPVLAQADGVTRGPWREITQRQSRDPSMLEHAKVPRPVRGYVETAGKASRAYFDTAGEWRLAKRLLRKDTAVEMPHFWDFASSRFFYREEVTPAGRFHRIVEEHVSYDGETEMLMLVEALVGHRSGEIYRVFSVWPATKSATRVWKLEIVFPEQAAPGRGGD